MPENPYKSPEAEGKRRSAAPVRIFRTTSYGAGIGFVSGLVLGTLGWVWVVIDDGSYRDRADWLEDARDQTIFYLAPICALLGLGIGFIIAISKNILRHLVSAAH